MDHVIPHVPVRQWVLSLSILLRVLLAAQPELVTPLLQVVQRVVQRRLLDRTGLKSDEGQGGAVTLSVDTGPPLRAGPCLAKGSRLQARARPARPMPREDRALQPLCADIDRFSLHAAVRVEAHDRKRLEQLCRYITRPPCRPRRGSGPALRQAQTVHRTV
jgi:hypothetical protein